MLKLSRSATAALLITLAVVTVQAAPATDFYSTLLRRGIAALEAGRNADAVHNLRIAAFGFVDSLDHYQTAQTYLALAHGRLSDDAGAREALRKLVAAERQNRRFSALELPANVRKELLSVAARLLSPAEAEALRQPASAAVRSPVATPATPPASTIRLPATAVPSTTVPKTTPAEAAPAPRTTPPVETTPPVTPPQPPVAREEPRVLPSPPATTTPASTTPGATQSPVIVDPPRETRRDPAPRISTPATVTPPPAAVQPPPPPRLSEAETLRQVALAERSLDASRLVEARAIYRELLERGTLSRALLLRVAEGLYRSRDFAPALEAFRRLGTLERGEEPYRYYVAVALYETGKYAEAKEMLRSALPFIEVTPDVARYRAKIEGAR